ncbi:unnamed protein product [Linum tenue]|uniref:RNase H type-1 domain-containing protein n=1 Tax=Linum tenue TaxID=586396 RepID=A0AAV0PJ73_9ROSI|nr:unnamed protein product [Linum tenue]
MIGCSPTKNVYDEASQILLIATCADKEETTEHILRSCERAKATWEKFRDKLTVRNSNSPFHQWLLDNISNEVKGVEFGVICWNLWKQRNEEVLDGKQFQTDGSVLSPSGKAAAGGLLRDHLGRCKEAFVCNLGTCSITSAELKGAVTGLKIARERGYRRVHLNLDSATAISIIMNNTEDDHRHGIIAKEFNFLLCLYWDVKVSYVYREANFAADFLAARGHLVDFGTPRFNVYDPELEHWLLHDIMGIPHDRLIINTI